MEHVTLRRSACERLVAQVVGQVVAQLPDQIETAGTDLDCAGLEQPASRDRAMPAITETPPSQKQSALRPEQGAGKQQSQHQEKEHEPHQAASQQA